MNGSRIIFGLLAIGGLTGLRTFTPIAVLCWMTMLGRVSADAGWLGFVANKFSVGIFTLAGLGELVADKLPSTPSRIQGPGLIARLVFGGLCGAILAATAGYPVLAGSLLGMTGAVVGAFVGWSVRTRAVAILKFPDFPTALVEDAIALGGSILVCSVFAHDLV